MSKPFTGRTGAWSNWCTPEHFLERVRRVGVIGLDPCANLESAVDARLNFFGPHYEGELPPGCTRDDGLVASWKDAAHGQLTFVNPPYNPMAGWVDKMCAEADAGTEIIALVASKTDTQWFHKIFKSATAGIFWKGRIAFDNPPPGTKGTAPSVSSFVAYWGLNVDRFFDAFSECGKAISLQTLSCGYCSRVRIVFSGDETVSTLTTEE